MMDTSFKVFKVFDKGASRFKNCFIRKKYSSFVLHAVFFSNLATDEREGLTNIPLVTF